MTKKMTKSIVSLALALCLVLSLAFVYNTKADAASKAGAYRAKCSFNVYINGFDAGSSNGAYAYPTNAHGFTYAITVPAGSTYAAGANGYITVYYGGGYKVYVYAPDCVKAGKMVKLY